jgi:hypothetical protein
MNRSRSARFSAFAMPTTMRIKRTLDVLLRLLTETDVTLAAFGSSMTLLFIGVLLALPNETLTQTTPLFRAMTRFLPEWAWALLFLAFGIFQSLANLSRNRGVRRYAAFCASLFFGFVGLLIAPVHPIGACFTVQAFVNVIVYWHLGALGARGAN